MARSATQFTIRNSGFARMPSQPKSTTCSSFGLTARRMSISLGPTYSEKWFTGPSLTAAPAKDTSFDSRGVERHLFRLARGGLAIAEGGYGDRSAPLRQERRHKVLVLDAGKRIVAGHRDWTVFSRFGCALF